jgi:branched-chain amino acid transport system permease protein
MGSSAGDVGEGELMRRYWLFFLLVMLFLLSVPFWIPSFFLFLVTEILTLSLFAMSFDLIYGYTGMLSLGHATFFGAGSYILTLSILYWQTNIWIALLLAMIGSAFFAWIIGFFAVRARGTNFVVITIIFSLVIFYLSFYYKNITGGDDGLSVRIPDLALGFLTVSIHDNPLANYYLVMVIVVFSYLFYRRLMHSPMGRLFLAVKSNEERAGYVGFNTLHYRLISFVISGAFSGLSGALYTMTTHYSNNKLLHWTTSIDVVVWTIVGGAGTLIGPILGTTIFAFFREFVSFHFKQYPIVIGVVLILFIVYVPQGLLGLAAKVFRSEGK